MKTVEEIRRENLAILAEEYGGWAKLANHLSINSSQISQWWTAAPDSKSGKPRDMSPMSARRIEEKCEKPRGWFDHEHDQILNDRIANYGDLQKVAETTIELNPRQKALLELFEGLTESQKDDVIKSLTETKSKNDQLLAELLERDKSIKGGSG